MTDNSIPIIAIDKETGKRVGEYPSIHKAARSLFIRSDSTIYTHIFGGKNSGNGMNFTKTPKGVTSYKTGIKYLFEVKIQ